MTKHTPGPWRFRRDKVGYSIEIIGADGYSLAGIADIRKDEHGRESEDLANARLIAAAPDMLSLLKIFVMGTADSHPDSLGRQRAMELIGKAEGRDE